MFLDPKNCIVVVFKKKHLQTPFTAPVTSPLGYIGLKHIYLWCRDQGHVLRPQKLHPGCILKNHQHAPFSAPACSIMLESGSTIFFYSESLISQLSKTA